MSHDELSRENPDDLKQVQETLAALAPRSPQVDRDRLMFLAGAAAAGGQRSGVGSRESAVVTSRNAWLWPAATAALGATSLALAIALVVRSGAPPQIVYVERPGMEAPQAIARANPTHESPAVAVVKADAPGATPRVAEPLAANRTAVPQVPTDNYLRSREVALRMGLDALGAPRSGGGSTSAVTYLDWLASQGDDSSSPPAAVHDSVLPQM